MSSSDGPAPDLPAVTEQGSGPSKRVVYLMGAGASHGCAARVGSPHGLLMDHLKEPLGLGMHDLVENEYKSDSSLTNLVNTLVSDQADFEHVVTFLDESPSGVHQAFAADLRVTFEKVLRDQLRKIQTDLGEDPVGLYSALFDMHNLPGFPECLAGVLTTNYDLYIEQGLAKAGFGPIDFGFPVRNGDIPAEGHTKLIKLHGSFGWTATWPPTTVAMDDADQGSTLWIPPGIAKRKQGYPFAVLWALAREILACDVPPHHWVPSQWQ